MPNKKVGPLALELFERFVQSLRGGTEREQVLARSAWFKHFPTRRGSVGGEPEKCGIRVIGRSDLGSGSGQLSLALILATEGGNRPATSDDIDDALRFWSGTTKLRDAAEYNHFDWMCRPPREWAVKNGDCWSLTVKGTKEISPEARRVLAAYLDHS